MATVARAAVEVVATVVGRAGGVVDAVEHEELAMGSFGGKCSERMRTAPDMLAKLVLYGCFEAVNFTWQTTGVGRELALNFFRKPPYRFRPAAPRPRTPALPCPRSSGRVSRRAGKRSAPVPRWEIATGARVVHHRRHAWRPPTDCKRSAAAAQDRQEAARSRRVGSAAKITARRTLEGSNLAAPRPKEQTAEIYLDSSAAMRSLTSWVAERIQCSSRGIQACVRNRAWT